jgi:hypothetical protein
MTRKRKKKRIFVVVNVVIVNVVLKLHIGVPYVIFAMIINILRIVNKNVIVIVAIVANVNAGIVGIKRIVAFIVLRKLNVTAWIVSYVKSLNIVLSYV